MYTVLKNTQIVIALLKEYGIKHVVISPGTRNGPFVKSIKDDSDFICYSVVDERSAAFFAMGIARQLNTPVVISCTSSTAACNYYSAITEAYYSHIPLVVLTSDRNPATRNQLEKQQIEQVGMYGKMVKKSVDLPMKVNDDEDFWYCSRLVNEAFLAMTHGTSGPVQINLPVYYDMTQYDVPKLPIVKRMYINELRHVLTENEKQLPLKLHNYKKIIVLCGACAPWDADNKARLQKFLATYNAVLFTEHNSNIGIPEEMHVMAGTDICNCFVKDQPDLLITIGGPTQLMIYEKLMKADVDNWIVSADGEVHDPARHLTDIFECSIRDFLEFFNLKAHDDWKNDGSYKAQVKASWDKFINSRPVLDTLTNVYCYQEFCKNVPDNSIISMSILNAIRGVETFELPGHTEVYANVGAYGIDGCMSTFMGQAAVTDKNAYLVIGDLSFLYDMNALWIRHIKDNVHILLINNFEGIEMHRFFQNDTDLPRFTTAGHHTSPKGWIEDTGFQYFSASTKEGFDSVLSEFLNCEKKCVFQVFTKEATDTKAAFDYYSYQATETEKMKKAVRNFLGDEGTEKLKKLLKR